MTGNDRHARVKRIFSDAAELPQAERTRFLQEQCGADATLRDAVDGLLRVDEQTAAGPLSVPLYRPDRPATSVQRDASFPRDDPFPEQIGKYRLLRKIGEGGMGVVYEAQQDKPRRTVALKLIRPGFASVQVLKRFEHEAQFLGQLQHPGIAQIFEAGVETVAWPVPPRGSEAGEKVPARYSYFAMEFVSGRMLTEYADSRRLATNERLELLARICDAVQFAHSKGVIHRDLKPANILVDELGQPKILDFGVARATNADAQATTMRTDIGQLIGTLPYMSPEQVAGDPSQIDARSDVYELGVILYELLAGRLPHDLRNRSLVDAARIIREEEPSRLSSINPALRGDLDSIVSKALEKNPQRRYASAADLADDLRRFLSNQPIRARPPSAWYQFRKFSRRNRGLVGGALATLIVLVIGIVVTTLLAIRASRLQNEAELRAALALRQTYRASLSAAAAALRNQDLRVATDNLRAAPSELRGWEWRHLNALVDRSVHVITRDCGRPRGLAASRDGRVLAVLDADGNAQIWDADTRERLRIIAAEPQQPTIRVSLSPDGTLLARTGSTGQTTIFDVHTGARLWSVASEPIEAAFTPDGRQVATADNHRCINLWDARSGSKARTINLEPGLPIAGIWISPDGRELQIAADGGRRSFYDLESGQPITSFATWALALNDDWTQSAYIDNERIVLDSLPTRQRLAAVPFNCGGSVQYLGFLPEGIGLLAYCEPGQAHILDPSLRAVMTYPVPVELVDVRAIPSAGRMLMATKSGSLLAWDLFTSTAPFIVSHPPRFATVCADVSPDTRRSAVAGWGDVRSYDTTTGELRWCVFPGRAWIMSLAFSPDGDQIAAGDGKGGLCLIDATNGEVGDRVVSGDDAVVSVQWLDSRRILAGDAKGRLVLLDRANLAAFRSLPGHASPIHCLTLSADGTTLASGSGDGVDYVDHARLSTDAGDNSVKLWDAEDLRCVATLPEPRSAVTAVEFSPDGSRLAAACFDGVVIVWNVASREPIATLHGVGECRALVFHPHEPRLLTWSFDGTVRVWDTIRFEEVATWHTAGAGACALAFSADGASLASAGRAAAVAMIESGTPAGGRERLLQLLAAAEIRLHERSLVADAVATIQANPLVSSPVRDVAVRELQRRGDHLNWMLSDAVISLQHREPAGLNEALEKAERCIRSAIARKSDEPAPWTLLGELQYRREQFDDAIGSLQRAMTCYGQRGQHPSVRVLTSLARSCKSAGKEDDARAALQQARVELQQNSSPDASDKELIAETARQLGEP